MRAAPRSPPAVAGLHRIVSPAMTTNRRYADHYDRLMDTRILQVLARDHTPETLTEAELDREHSDYTVPPRPRPCTAWVRYAGKPVLVDAEICGWTPRAAAIRWRVDESRVDRAWVWASAVEPVSTTRAV